MAWGFLQATAVTSDAGTPQTLAFGSDVAAGSRILVLGCSHDDVGVTAVDHVIDHTGVATVDSWSTIVGPVDSADGAKVRVRLWTAHVTVGGTMTVRITQSGGSNPRLYLAIAEYSGLSAASGAEALDVSHTSTAGYNSSGALDSGTTAATSAASELVFGGLVDNGLSLTTISGGAGFQKRAGVNPSGGGESAIEEKDSGASGNTQIATFTSSATANNGVGLVAVMKLAPMSQISHGYGRN